jgi:hypothetical protein
MPTQLREDLVKVGLCKEPIPNPQQTQSFLADTVLWAYTS